MPLFFVKRIVAGIRLQSAPVREDQRYMAEKAGRSVVLTIPARQDCVGLARLTLGGLCSFTQMGVDEISDIKVALTEAAECFIDERRDAKINFAFELSDSRLSVKVSGERLLNNVKVGFSRLVLDSLADESEYGSKRVRFVKYLGQRRVHAGA